MSARIGEHQDRTRLVIELSDPVNLRAFALASPDRVVIDMPEVSCRLGAPPRPSGYGPVKSYRFGQFRVGNSRMVIDLNAPVTVSDALVIPPSSGFGYRVVIDLFPVSRAKFDAQAGDTAYFDPLSGSFIESDGTDNSAANLYSAFYANSVDDVRGAFGMVVPNLLTTGVRRVERRSLASGSVVTSATASTMADSSSSRRSPGAVSGTRRSSSA
jgi:hypothetical protein